MNPGDTFLIPDAIGTHLNCVLKIFPDGGLVLCHLTSLQGRSDKTCVIQPGEHSFVTKPTIVRYDQCQHLCTEEGLKALERLIWKRFEPLSAELLARIIQGALNSPQTPDKIKALLK
jgi:hypothetical protein